MSSMGGKYSILENRRPSIAETQQVLLWAISIHGCHLDTSAQSPLMQKYLTKAEIEKVGRFIRVPDQQRALLSILLQRSAVAHCFPSLTTSDYDLPRTREGKPFLKIADHATGNSTAGTWNFNVSHHGDFVCIATHPHLLVGADIVDIDANVANNRIASPKEFIDMFNQQLTGEEMAAIFSQQSDAEQYIMFFLHWALKEAFIKAIGQGLGYDLQRVRFSIELRDRLQLMREEGSIIASVSAIIDGQLRNDWSFTLMNLDHRHVLAVAYGPLQAALPSFCSAAGWTVQENVGEDNAAICEISPPTVLEKQLDELLNF